MYTYIKSILMEVVAQEVVLERPKNKDFGHYATPIAFSLAKKLKKSPKYIADEICLKLRKHEYFKQVININGYINLTLSSSCFNYFVNDALVAQNNFGKSKINHRKILLEYVSANPTGPLHIGHTRGAVLGDALRRIGEYLGYIVQTEYYVNDAGLQIDMLGESIMLAGREHILKTKVVYPDNYYKGDYILEIAYLASEKFGKNIFKDDKHICILSQFGKDLMLQEIQSNLTDIGIYFDNFVSEKSLFQNWNLILKALKKNKGVYEQDKKVWLASTKYNDEKDRVVVREDKNPTYLAGDIIYHNYKFERDFDSYINIWGADHHGYIARVKAAIAFLGYDPKKLHVLLTQMVSLLKDGQPYKMSKRAGNFILMRDVVADIGADALRFIFLSKKPDTHLEFDLSDLNKQDSSNPIFYINYANARIHTLLQKTNLTQDEILQTDFGENTEILDLLFLSLQLPRIVQMAWEDKSLQKVCEYLKSLASEFHAFYNNNKILYTAEEKEYLKMCKMVSLSLTLGLSLLGIKAKERM